MISIMDELEKCTEKNANKKEHDIIENLPFAYSMPQRTKKPCGSYFTSIIIQAMAYGIFGIYYVLFL